VEENREKLYVGKVCFSKALMHRRRAGATIADLVKVSGAGRDTIRRQENSGFISFSKAYQILNGLNALLAGAKLEVISPEEFEENLVRSNV